MQSFLPRTSSEHGDIWRSRGGRLVAERRARGRVRRVGATRRNVRCAVKQTHGGATHSAHQPAARARSARRRRAAWHPGPRRRPQPPKRQLARPQRVVVMQSVSAADPASVRRAQRRCQSVRLTPPPASCAKGVQMEQRHCTSHGQLSRRRARARRRAPPGSKSHPSGEGCRSANAKPKLPHGQGVRRLRESPTKETRRGPPS